MHRCLHMVLTHDVGCYVCTYYMPWIISKMVYCCVAVAVLRWLYRVRTDSKTVSRTFQDLQRPNSMVFQDSENSFSRTFEDKFGSQHGCIRSKKCTYQISYWCNCIIVTVMFLKFKLTQGNREREREKFIRIMQVTRRAQPIEAGAYKTAHSVLQWISSLVSNTCTRN